MPKIVQNLQKKPKIVQKSTKLKLAQLWKICTRGAAAAAIFFHLWPSAPDGWFIPPYFYSHKDCSTFDCSENKHILGSLEQKFITEESNKLPYCGNLGTSRPTHCEVCGHFWGQGWMNNSKIILCFSQIVANPHLSTICIYLFRLEQQTMYGLDKCIVFICQL